MIYTYAFILCIILTLIISFRKYNFDTFEKYIKKGNPIHILYGFSSLLINSLKKLFSRKADAPEIYEKKLMAVSYGILAFTILIFFGFLSELNFTDTNLEEIKKANYKEESTLSTENDESASEESTSPQEKNKHITDIINIFEKNRIGIESAFLNENESLYTISKPVNLISSYGEEKIKISWSFENDSLIDKQGNILFDNITDSSCATLAYAKLTLDDVTATLTIPINICLP